MIVSSLSPHEIARALGRNGLCLRIGQHVVHIRSPLQSVAQGIHLLYADYPLEADLAFADFHVSVVPPKNLRRWIAPQALFRFDHYAPFKPLPADQAFPLLEWGLNWCFSTQYHRYAVIHGAAVEKHGRALILPAPPGSGKSTLCAALVTRGWRLLSDELALLTLDDLSLAPLCRPLSLKNESLDIIREFEPAATFGPPVFDTSKGTVGHMRAPADSVLRGHERARPAWIVFPRYQAGAATQLSPHPKASAYMQIAANTFNYSMLGVQGFETLSRLVSQCDCHDFTYSNLNQAMDVFNALAST